MRGLLCYELFQTLCGRRCVYLGLVEVRACFHGAYGNRNTSLDSSLWKTCLATRLSWNNPGDWKNAESALHLYHSRALGRARSQSRSPVSCKSSTTHPLLWVFWSKCIDNKQQHHKKGYYEQKEFELSWRKDFIIQANPRISLDEPLLKNLIKVLGEVANPKLMRAADGTKVGSILRAVDDRSNTGDWERLELGIEIKKTRFLHGKRQANTSGRIYCAK